MNNNKEYTCKNISGNCNKFVCSECGLDMYIFDHLGFLMSLNDKSVKYISFCPNCGREVEQYNTVLSE